MVLGDDCVHKVMTFLAVADARRGVGATAANVWPGWTCAGITDRSNILIRFPPDATPRQRAALLATMMLVEFSHFEWKKGEHEGNLAYAL